MSRHRTPRISSTPIAVTSAGQIALNGAYLLDTDDPHEIIETLGSSAELYIGVILPQRHVREVLRRLDDAASEIAGVIGPGVISGVVEVSVRAGAASRVPGRGQRAARRQRQPGRQRRPAGRAR
jgi:hypothetical protein